jgi:hypothetical protein
MSRRGVPWHRNTSPDGFAQLEDIIDPAEVDAFVKRYKAVAGHRQAAMGEAAPPAHAPTSPGSFS